MPEQTSFAEKYGKKNSMTSSNPFAGANNQNPPVNQESAVSSNQQTVKKPIDPQKRALAQYIYLVKGVDAGRNAWYYVLVEKLKVQLFLKALNDDIIHLEKYGKILYSAYGDEPPASVTQLIKDEYGID
jgi:hypothetical protein